MAAGMTDTFTCPRCGMTSAHPKDVEQGYCGNCHDWTGGVMAEQSDRYKAMLARSEDTLDLELRRSEIQSERTFSEAAVDEVIQDMATWLGTRLVRRWESTGEPPTFAHIILTVEVG
jgi:predicted ATP-dependent serine protease